MATKYLLSFDPGAGGDFFNHMITQNQGFCKAKTEPGINNNTIYYNPTNDLGIEFKQIPMIMHRDNQFGLSSIGDILNYSENSRRVINNKINETYTDNLCLGTHWYDTDISKWLLDNTVFVKLETKQEYLGLFFTLVFLKNWDHNGYNPYDKQELLELTTTIEKKDKFLSLDKARGWERYVIDWDVPVNSMKISDCFEPFYNSFRDRFLIKEYNDNWNYIDIGDLWFRKRKDLKKVNDIYNIELKQQQLDDWANNNLMMIFDKFNLRIGDFKDDNWIEPVKEYFIKSYNE